uniref:ATP synthase F0 subunit 6 n=1 Tax=Glossiphonia complanata TaxID=60927 RepID=UPI00206D7309|nr:ATP synthase F0 subunit 6 [Glossiphonia complanata]UPP55802.1 ATP synthase F0 subunit 6 [Glossiphonia complanata]UZT67726.1 ATP synthase F0 subunit 6 [Glossiphonia complanata]
MLMDIFSSFDSYEFNSFSLIKNPILLMSMIILTLMMMSSMWLSSNRMNSTMIPLINLIFNQLSRTKSTTIKGYTMMVSMMFILIIFINLMGMIPYSFSISTHLILTLSLGLPMWMSIISSSLSNNKKEFIAMLLPDGAPNWLNPFLILIETISIMVRPLTLSFRLAANMSAGHIVLSLLGIYLSAAMNSSFINTTILLMLSTGYILFEFAICLIQSYIFCLLLSLYTDDHTSNH